MNKLFRFNRIVAVVGLLVGLCACSIAKGASSAVLTWDANPDPLVAGYNVYYGVVSGVYTNEVNVGDNNSVVIDGLAEGQTYYFAVTAYDDFGDESGYSAEVVYIVPGWLTITPGTNAGDPLRIQFPVASGQSYQLQSSPDLQTWTPIWQVTGVANQWVEYDAPIGTAPTMYYRVLLQ